MSIVLFLNGSALLLTDVRRGRKGQIIRGWVVNGAWTLAIEGTKAYAMSGNKVVTTFPVGSCQEVKVKARGDYNNVIEAARRIIALPGS